uniref:EGF-like domain-containing protein n=1 Tax=Anopheles epiroticus TaxID=199890 RepID=A0A182PUY1_9DIPT
MKINSTSSDDNASNGEVDVLYQRGASFSAKLDISDLHISMKSFDDDDAQEDTGGQEAPKAPPSGTAPSKYHPPSNGNSIIASDELARRKANRNWKLEPVGKPSANAHGGVAGRGRSSSRREKSIQNDGLPALVTAYGDGMRHEQQQKQLPKTSATGSDRRKFNATSAGRKGSGAGADDGTGSSSSRNVPPASDMEISGISLHSTLSGGEPARWQRAGVPEMEASSASAALLAVDEDDDDDDASEIRALPLMAGSQEDEGMQQPQREGKLPPEAMGRSSVESPQEPIMHGVNGDGLTMSAVARDNATQPAAGGTTISQPCTLDCGSEGTCYVSAEGSSTLMRCLCAFGKTGQRCEEVNHAHLVAARKEPATSRRKGRPH